MKDIVFIFPADCYPVPAINGGAVESLITSLIIENEKTKKFMFHIVMQKDYNDKYNYDYSEYKFSKFYNFYINKNNVKVAKLVNAINKRVNYSLPLYMPYERYIVEQVKKINPDLVIYEGAFNSSVRKISKIIPKQNVLYHVHHQVLPKFNLSKFFGGIICVSDFIKKDWQEYGKLSKDFKYMVLKNVITSDNFLNKVNKKDVLKVREQLNINQKDFVVVYCGRLVKVKGVDLLIKAINELNNDNIKLMIVGESAFKNSKITPYVKEIQSLTENNPNVVFTGFVPNNELNKYYASADLQVIPSVWEEAAGIVALEGMALGKPQIITNSGGLPEFASKFAIIIDKSKDVVLQLKNEISKFYEGEYRNLSFDKEKPNTGKEYYQKFVELFKEDEKNK